MRQSMLWYIYASAVLTGMIVGALYGMIQGYADPLFINLSILLLAAFQLIRIFENRLRR